jgi:hypothetical protein
MSGSGGGRTYACVCARVRVIAGTSTHACVRARVCGQMRYVRLRECARARNVFCTRVRGCVCVRVRVLWARIIKDPRVRRLFQTMMIALHACCLQLCGSSPAQYCLELGMRWNECTRTLDDSLTHARRICHYYNASARARSRYIFKPRRPMDTCLNVLLSFS